jgi:hypothetical protein
MSSSTVVQTACSAGGSVHVATWLPGADNGEAGVYVTTPLAG